MMAMLGVHANISELSMASAILFKRGKRFYAGGVPCH